MYPVQDNGFQQQLASLQAQLNQLSHPTAQLANVPQPGNELETVSGIEGARQLLASMPANSKRVAWDSTGDRFFLLQKDANGTAQQIMIGSFTLAPEPKPEDKFVTKDDFNAFVAEIKSMLPQKGEVTNG